MLSEARCIKFNLLLKACCALISLLLVFGCNSGGGNDPYMYDRIGRDNVQRNVSPYYGARPINNQPSYPNPSNRYEPQYQQGQYPQYPQRQYQRPQAPQGGSRYYDNPYDEPPLNQRPQYDSDQYYVPPSYSNNLEPQFQDSYKPGTSNAY